MHQIQRRDLADTISWARRTSADPNVLYLDTETTGLDSGAEIVDIAVIDSSGQVLLETLVRPDRPIPPDATRIHGITNAMVAGAARWPEIAPQVGRLLSRASSVVIYNAEFDARIMDQCNARCRLPRYRASWHCAMKQYACFAGRRHDRYGGYRWHKLTDAAATFGYRDTIQHRALADARLCRAVVYGMAGWRPG